MLRKERIMARVDQAEGLRRLLEVPKLKVYSFLSVLSDSEKNSMLINLSDCIARRGQKIILVDAKSSSTSIGAWLNVKSDHTLLDVARQQRTMETVVREVNDGFSVAMVSKFQGGLHHLPSNCLRELSKTFDLALSHSDVALVDAEIDEHDCFQLASLDESELVIQLSTETDTIKAAYGLIKRLNNRLGRRQYDILVSGSDVEQAHLVFENLARTASRYLAVQLRFFGFVPEDSYLKRATQMGRSVLDAFPKALSSIAFSSLADGIKRNAPTPLYTKQLSHLGAQLEL
jgi:flagellar biosynthesis protein FlhG